MLRSMRRMGPGGAVMATEAEEEAIGAQDGVTPAAVGADEEEEAASTIHPVQLANRSPRKLFQVSWTSQLYRLRRKRTELRRPRMRKKDRRGRMKWMMRLWRDGSVTLYL